MNQTDQDQPKLPRVWLEVSRSGLKTNLKRIQEYVSPLKVMAVLKANAYGLGVLPAAEVFKEAGAAAFGVAEVSNAELLKPLGVPIHILGALTPEELASVVQGGFIAPITDLRTAELLNAEAGRQGKTAKGQFKIDTGMGRLGILENEALEVILQASRLPNLEITGIYSHFPHAYGDADFSKSQVNCFLNLLKRCNESGIIFQDIHIANSDGIHNIPAAIRKPFTMVRTGINLYGAYDTEGQRAFEVQEVLSLKSRLVAVRNLPQGASIGYGRSFVLDQPMRVGTVSIGYADGVPFAISGRGSFLVSGKRCPVIGRISMDFTTIDLSEAPQTPVGAEVVCLGHGISVAEWAEISSSISYQIICSFGSRVERVYL